MRRSSLPVLLLVFLFSACGEDQPSTAPAAPEGAADPALSHTAGHKVVNSLADPGDGTCNVRQCTLREAIEDPASTRITFAPGLAGAITLAKPGAGGGSLVIEKALTITGPTAGITIRRRGTDPAFRILRVGHATVALTNLTLSNGKEIERPGGGITSFGTLTLTNCSVVGNTSAQHGGGIDNHGPLTLTNSTVSGNSAARGAGIDNHNFTVTATNSTITRNSGGGIADLGGTLVISNSAVTNNTGSGIWQNRGTSTLDHVRIVGNSSSGEGGGILLVNTRMTVTNSTIALNSATDGGGIFNWFRGGLTIINSTVANNTATGAGGGIRSEAFGRAGVSFTLTNTTVSSNAAAFGGGISIADDVEAFSDASLTNSTVAFNSATREGGGIAQHAGNGASIALTNSIVARNTAPTAPDISNPDVGVGFVAAAFSLIGDGTGSSVTNDNGNQVGNVSPNTSPIDPELGPLAANGGPTRTHALEQGSPAIDAAATADCPATDQRGVTRPQGTGCDIGSYERE